jgi:hypothetical protein
MPVRDAGVGQSGTELALGEARFAAPCDLADIQHKLNLFRREHLGEVGEPFALVTGCE